MINALCFKEYLQIPISWKCFSVFIFFLETAFLPFIFILSFHIKLICVCGVKRDPISVFLIQIPKLQNHSFKSSSFPMHCFIMPLLYMKCLYVYLFLGILSLTNHFFKYIFGGSIPTKPIRHNIYLNWPLIQSFLWKIALRKQAKFQL